MANVKSAEKRNRQNQKRRARNQASKSTVRTATLKALEAIRKDAKAAVTVLSDVASVLAKAAHRGGIPKRRAARKISRLQKALNKANSAAKA